MAQKRANSEPTQADDEPKSRRLYEGNINRFDAILHVQDRKFYGIKMHLANHSGILNQLLFHPHACPKQKEFTLHNVNPDEFQHFLEIINGETCLSDENVEKVLKLAKTLEARIVIKQCEGFLMKHSEMTTKKKFELAVEDGFEALKIKSVNSIASASELLSIVSDDFKQQFDEPTKDLLFQKSLQLHTVNTPPRPPVAPPPPPPPAAAQDRWGMREMNDLDRNVRQVLDEVDQEMRRFAARDVHFIDEMMRMNQFIER